VPNLEYSGTIMNIDELKAFVDSKFRLPLVEGEDKVCPLDEAVGTHVKKGTSISFAGGGGVLVNQLVREFWDMNAARTASILATRRCVVITSCRQCNHRLHIC